MRLSTCGRMLPALWCPCPTTSQFIRPSASTGLWGRRSVLPAFLLAGPLSSAIGTARNIPPEYGTHWNGFAKRNGMRLTGIATGNLIEAGLGAIWGEDPRYFPSPRRGVWPRVKYVIRTTFLAPHRDGSWHPAYARVAGDLGNNFLSNTWRADSEAKTSSALVRWVWGVVGRM